MEDSGVGRAGDDGMDIFDLYLIIRKRLGLIFVLTAVSVFAAAIIGFSTAPVYKGSILIRVPSFEVMQASGAAFVPQPSVPVISIAETERLIRGLDELRKEGRFEELSSKLNLPEERVRKLVSLKAMAIKGNDAIVEATVEVLDSTLVRDFKDALFGYLNGNRYVAERIALRRDELTLYAAEIAFGVSDMGALKKAITHHAKRGGLNSVGFNPLEMEKEYLALTTKLRNVENEIRLLKGFETAVETNVPQSPARPRKMRYILVAGVSAIFAGVLLAFLLELPRRRNKGV